MSLKTNFELMADYNQWMNTSIFEAASTLSDAEFTQNRGTFFGSISGTLNHILVGDTIWLKRFAAHPESFKALDYVCTLETPKALDIILTNEFEYLRSARIKMDRAIQAFTYELTDDVLLSSLSYVNTNGDTFTKSFSALVQHLFNHQTHHRGQVSIMLCQAGIDLGPTDLLINIQNTHDV